MDVRRRVLQAREHQGFRDTNVFPNISELLLCQLLSLTSHHVLHVHPNTRAV